MPQQCHNGWLRSLFSHCGSYPNMYLSGIPIFVCQRTPRHQSRPSTYPSWTIQRGMRSSGKTLCGFFLSLKHVNEQPGIWGCTTTPTYQQQSDMQTFPPNPTWARSRASIHGIPTYKIWMDSGQIKTLGLGSVASTPPCHQSTQAKWPMTNCTIHQQ